MDKGQKGEDFVSRLAFQSFLQFWCFPGPLDITGDYKEICDLLVVFDKVCIIVSVKNYSFSGNYTRYFKKTIEKAIRQIDGAERKLFGERPILLKHPNRSEQLFRKDEIEEVIRVVVNLNDQVKYYQTSHFNNEKHFTVMDAPAWKNAIEELDTISDFVNYIKARCELFKEYPAFIMPREEYDFGPNDGMAFGAELDELVSREGKSTKFTIVSGSELDLIALYIKHFYTFPDMRATYDTNSLSLQIDGEWDKYVKSKGKEFVETILSEGYFIDKMVKEMLIQKENGHKLAKIFYSLNRIERTRLSKHIHEYHVNCLNSEQPLEYNRTHYVGNGLNFVFMYFTEDSNMVEINEIAQLSIIHHAYLHNFDPLEIGLLGISENLELYLFGYSEQIVLTQVEIDEYKETFKVNGWKTI